MTAERGPRYLAGTLLDAHCGTIPAFPQHGPINTASRGDSSDATPSQTDYAQRK